jgi:hypothetical protein
LIVVVVGAAVAAGDNYNSRNLLYIYYHHQNNNFHNLVNFQVYQNLRPLRLKKDLCYQLMILLLIILSMKPSKKSPNIVTTDLSMIIIDDYNYI